MENKTLTDDEIKVLKFLYEETNDEMCVGFDWISSNTEIDRKKLPKIFKSLREKGFVQFYRGLMNDDGEVAGSGYCISYNGKRFLHPCKYCNDYGDLNYTLDDNGLIPQDKDFNKETAKMYNICFSCYDKKPWIKK